MSAFEGGFLLTLIHSCFLPRIHWRLDCNAIICRREFDFLLCCNFLIRMNNGWKLHGTDLKSRRAILLITLCSLSQKMLDVCIWHFIANAKFLLTFNKHRVWWIHMVNEYVKDSIRIHSIWVMIDGILGDHFINFMITMFPHQHHFPKSMGECFHERFRATQKWRMMSSFFMSTCLVTLVSGIHSWNIHCMGHVLAASVIIRVFMDDYSIVNALVEIDERAVSS